MILGIGISSYLLEEYPFGYLAFGFLSTIGLMKLIGANNKERFSGVPEPVESYPYQFTVYTATAVVIKSATVLLLPRTDYFNPVKVSCGVALYFIPKSFLMELVYDFVHYSLHRMMHLPLLYSFIHKKHHHYPNPITETSFVMTPLDLVLSYTVPLYISTKLFPVSALELELFNVYLLYQEIAGHSGKKTSPSSSFAQCVYLPRFLGIQLYAEDHNLHHLKLNCNYSKRFSLWDKLFGTFVEKKK